MIRMSIFVVLCVFWGGVLIWWSTFRDPCYPKLVHGQAVWGEAAYPHNEAGGCARKPWWLL